MSWALQGGSWLCHLSRGAECGDGGGKGYEGQELPVRPLGWGEFKDGTSEGSEVSIH